VNLHWRDSHLDDFSSDDNVLRCDWSGREPECGNGIQQTPAVVFGRADQEIDVAGIARGTVEGQRVRADHDELNVVGVQ
jgi:hypothetical protein